MYGRINLIMDSDWITDWETGVSKKNQKVNFILGWMVEDRF
jgi:hypothetical protein